MGFEEQQVRDDDIGRRDGLLGVDQRSGVFAPFGGGVDGNIQPRKSRPAECESSVRMTKRYAL
jgi:hypothetical protein